MTPPLSLRRKCPPRGPLYSSVLSVLYVSLTDTEARSSGRACCVLGYITCRGKHFSTFNNIYAER